MGTVSRWRLAAAAAAGCVLLSSLSDQPAGAAPTATADLASAQARAAELNATVDRLQLQAELSTEAYSAATDELAQLSTESLTSEQRLDDLRLAADRVQARNSEHVRVLYQSQGDHGVLGALLGGGTPNDVLDFVQVAAAVTASNRSSAAVAGAGVREGADIASATDALQRRQGQLTHTAARQADRVHRSLSAAAAAFAGADAEVRRIAAAERRAAEAADARVFAARLAAAQQQAAAQTAALAAGMPDLLGGPGELVGAAMLPPPTLTAGHALAAARTRLGLPYLWGAVGPESFDCSGLTGWAYRQAGLPLPRTSRQQWNAGPHPTLAQLAPGDLLFWATDTADPTTIHHVALYLGGGQMIAAPHSGAQVREQPVYANGYIGAVRPTVT